MVLSNVMEEIFWNLYAIVYDSIAQLKPYQDMQEEVLQQSFCRTDELLSQISLLDAGCGTGNFLKVLEARRQSQELDGVKSESRIPRVVTEAVDASPIMMSRARRKCKRLAITWGIIDLNAPLPQEDKHFDRIVCTNVIFALDNPKNIISEFRRVLKPGGRIVLATPRNHFDTNRILMEHMREIGGIGEWLRFIPILLPLGAATLLNCIVRWKARSKVYHFFDEEELSSLFRSVGFSKIRIQSTYADQDWLVIAERPSPEVCREGSGSHMVKAAV